MIRLQARLAALLILSVAHAAWAQPRPVLRYVFDRSGTQYDIGTAPAANATLSTSAVPVSNSPNSFSCASLDLTANSSNQNYAYTGSDVAKIDALATMTVTFWVNMRANPAVNDRLASDMPSGYPAAGTGGWEMRIGGASPTASSFLIDFVLLKANGGYNSYESVPSSAINANQQWVFLALTFDASRQRTWYIGSTSSSVSQFGAIGVHSYGLLDNASELRIGGATSDPTVDHTPPAWIDDFRIYNTVLTLAQMNAVRLENMQIPNMAAVPGFFSLGGIVGGSCAVFAQGISADGSTVVGQASTPDGPVGYRWKNGVRQALADLAGGSTYASARSVSADGSVAVGQGSPSTGTNLVGVKWDAAGNVTALPDFPNADVAGDARGVSADGSVIAGMGVDRAGPLYDAARWVNGVISPLGYLPGDSQSAANDVSRDGLAFIGVSGGADTSQGFFWQAGVMTALPDLPGGTQSCMPWRLSANKEFAVGYGESDLGHEAALWAKGRVIGLGDLPTSTFSSEAYGVSARGSRIVGMGRILSQTGSSITDAFIWDRAHGMRSLYTVLTSDYGLDLTGWQLRVAAGISDDGSVIAGYGVSPAGLTDSWIAKLPAPPPLGDFDGDNDVDFTDAGILEDCSTGANVPYNPNIPAGCGQAIDVLGLIPADLDWDGDVDGDDFAAFQRCYGTSPALVDPSCRG